MPENEGENEEEDLAQENYSDFTIFISDSNGSSGLVIEATTMDTEVAFNNVLVTDDIKKMRSIPRFERSRSDPQL